MSIIRAPRRETNFYVLDKRISEDKSLSWAARGLLVFLLGKPAHWVVSVQALINETSGSRIKSGRDAVWALLGELMAAGYCQRVQSRNEDGTMGGMNYMISESASFAKRSNNQPLTDNPGTAEPGTANPLLVSTDKKQGLKKKQGLTPSSPSPSSPAAPLSPDGGHSSTATDDPPAPRSRQTKPKAPLPNETALQAACRATWTAYSTAYSTRYGTAPLRNAKVNAAIKGFVQRVGHDESPAVAGFFVDRVADPLVVRRMHDTGLLLANAEAYRTQWVTGRTPMPAPPQGHNKHSAAAKAIFDDGFPAY